MPDPYLEAMMHGDFTPKDKKSDEVTPPPAKDSFDIAIEKQIDAYIDSLNLEEEFGKSTLISPEMKKKQIREEMKANLKMPEIEGYITAAFKALRSEGEHYLGAELYKEMIDEFDVIIPKLEVMDLSQPVEENFQTLLNISDEVMTGIFGMAIEKYKEGDYSTSLSIFTLLTTLDSGNSEYWYRLGIASQRFENYDMALKAYETSIELEPDLMEAYLFASECCLHKGDLEGAKVFFKKGKELADAQELDEVWSTLIKEIASVL